jgi:uncharacterized protein YcbX
MDAAVTAIYRYPVKGLSAEALDRIGLAPGQCLPHDRRFAVALATTEFDPDNPAWLSKTHFIMLMRDETLAELTTRFDPASAVLSIARGQEMLLEARLTEPEGQRRIAAFFDEFMGGKVSGPLRIVEAAGHAFADSRPKPNASTDKYVSLINRNSIRDLEAKIGAEIDPIRFRANVYFDGPPAWAEHEWLEREIAVGFPGGSPGGSPGGNARLRVIATITRCAATEVNPATAERDLDIVGGLRRHFGHNLMGIYAEVLDAGDIAVGDPLV